MLAYRSRPLARDQVLATLMDLRRIASLKTDDSALMVIPLNGHSALDQVEASDDERRLRDALGTLDPMRRKLVIAAYIQGRSREQLAQPFGAPVNTIKTWLRRAALDMRAVLEAGDEQRVA